MTKKITGTVDVRIRAHQMTRIYHPSKKMLEAIGRVAIAATELEEKLHFVHWHYASIPGYVGRVITGDMRPKRILEDTVKMAKATVKNPRRVAALQAFSTEYTDCAQLRNSVIHWIWRRSVKKGHFLNPPLYMSKPREDKPYTVAEINGLARKLDRLATMAQAHTMTDQKLREFAPYFERQYVRITSVAPWIDRPPQPNPKRSQSRATRKSPPHPHRA